jgi:protein-S-isoprenylcysteine O-methyltransferase Ste14
MNGKNIAKELREKLHHKVKVHHILAQSYSTAFFFFLIGVSLDIVFPIKIFEDSVMLPVGFVFLTFASLLIFWAQRTSRNLKNEKEIKKETFCKGPYCYSRIPTHWGIFLLMLGFGIMANALFVIATTLFSFLLSKLVFLKKEEAILEEKYGTPYLEYKKSVKL